MHTKRVEAWPPGTGCGRSAPAATRYKESCHDTVAPEEHLCVAREIAPDVYCWGHTVALKTNVYFIRSGSLWALIDAGWAKDGPHIKKAAECVFGPTRVQRRSC